MTGCKGRGQALEQEDSDRIEREVAGTIQMRVSSRDKVWDGMRKKITGDREVEAH